LVEEPEKDLVQAGKLLDREPGVLYEGVKYKTHPISVKYGL